MECPQCKKKLPRKMRFCIHCRFDLSTLTGFFNSRVLPAGFVLDRRFRIKEYVTSGGMANVYRVIDSRLDREFALKEMMDNYNRPEDRAQAVERFKREAKILTQLSHPAIPRIICSFVENERYYLVMDFIEGSDLESLIESAPEGRLSQVQVLELFWQLADVLKYLHSFNPPIIYRDLKPSNILVGKNNRLYLIDFGIARIFSPEKKGTLIGTPGYTPPEQYAGEVSESSDIYALGATLHHLLTGRDPQKEIPFSFPPVKDLIPDVDETLSNAIEKSLTYSAATRVQSIEEFEKLIITSDNSGKARKWYNEAILKLNSGDIAGAESAFSQSLIFDPKNSWAFLNRGKARFKAGNIDGAIEDYQSAKKLNDENAEIFLHLGIAEKEHGDIIDAEDSLNYAIAIDPGSFLAYSALGDIHFMQERWDQAILCYENALFANSSFAEASEKLEEARKKQAAGERIRKFDQATGEIDPAKAYYNLAMYFMEWGKLDEAEAEFAKAQRVSPDDPDVYEGLGQLYLRKSIYQKACENFEKAIAAAPESIKSYLLCATAQDKSGNAAKAAETLEKGIDCAIKNTKDWEKSATVTDMAKMLADIFKKSGIKSEKAAGVKKAITSGKISKKAFLSIWK